MKKIVGYGASVLLIAGACGLVFGVSQAEAGYFGHNNNGDGKGGDAGNGGNGGNGGDAGNGGNGGNGDDLEGLCECVEKALMKIKEADKKPNGKVKHPDKVLDDVKDKLKFCLDKFCDDSSCPM